MKRRNPEVRAITGVKRMKKEREIKEELKH
jgi:hypothetical protein